MRTFYAIVNTNPANKETHFENDLPSGNIWGGDGWGVKQIFTSFKEADNEMHSERNLEEVARGFTKIIPVEIIEKK